MTLSKRENISAETNVSLISCPLCKGKGQIYEELIDARCRGFFRDLLKTGELNAFISWCITKWRSEPEKSVSQIVHREFESVVKGINKAFGEFAKDLTKKIENNNEPRDKIAAGMKEILAEFSDKTTEKLTEIQNTMDLSKYMRQEQGRDFEKRTIEVIESEFSHWDFEETDSKVGDCVVVPKIKKNNDEYEPTSYKILLEISIEKKVSTKKLRTLETNMRKRNAQFGVVIVESPKQLAKKYYPFWIEGNIAIASFENGTYKIALRTFATLIQVLNDNNKKPEEVDWDSIKAVITEILQEERKLQTDMNKITLNLGKYVKSTNTRILERVQKHWNFVDKRIRDGISKLLSKCD